jgi:HlyD family secretion protein
VKDAPFGNIGPEALRLEQATIDYQLAKTLYEQLVLGPREIEIAVAKARIALAQATLAQAQVGARPEDVANAEADVAAAEAALKNLDADVASATAVLKQAQAALADTELRAPFDGAVAALNVKAGEMIPPAGFAVRLVDPSAWEIETTDLTELNVAEVQAGTTATMTFDALPGLELKGKVRRVRTVGESRQGDIVYTVIISPDQHSPRLRWNMTAKVTLEGAVQR